MLKKPQIIKAREVAKTAIFRIEELSLRFSNGAERTYERLGTFNSPRQTVMVVPVTEKKQFVLIEEYSVGTESYELGFPKGKIDPGETLHEGAGRELMEEAGFGAKNLEPIMQFSLSPQYMCHKMHVMLAQDLYEASLPGDEPEPLTVHIMNFAEIIALIAEGRLLDVRTIAALYLIQDRLLHSAPAI